MSEKNRGGARRGTGPKPIGGGDSVRLSVTLSTQDADVLKKLGDGKIANGIRMAAKMLVAAYQSSATEVIIAQGLARSV